MTGKRVDEIKAMDPRQRAALIVALFQRALQKATSVQEERELSLTVEVEEWVNRYCAFAGWVDDEHMVRSEE